jgi:hypothetical protein
MIARRILKSAYLHKKGLSITPPVVKRGKTCRSIPAVGKEEILGALGIQQPVLNRIKYPMAKQETSLMQRVHGPIA